MSKDAIKGLQPELLWESFYGISQVPRPSKKEELIREHVRGFAKKHGLEFSEDETGNIVISVPATEGYENSETVVIQGHVDMVCEKNKGTKHNFDTDPIELIREGDWIKANGTTLGSDNGIGVAAGMALALDKDAVHGPLELLCTVDEETGLTGANNLQPGFVKGKILLNLDSEEDGTFYVGCAGGQDTIGYLKPQFEEIEGNYRAYELMITGLKGGHSGLDIKAGRANAIKLLARLLNKLQGIDFKIGRISGGSLRNAIPREAEVLLFLQNNDLEKFKERINEFCQHALLEFRTNDGGLKIVFEKTETDVKKAYSQDFLNTVAKSVVSNPSRDYSYESGHT